MCLALMIVYQTIVIIYQYGTIFYLVSTLHNYFWIIETWQKILVLLFFLSNAVITLEDIVLLYGHPWMLPRWSSCEKQSTDYFFWNFTNILHICKNVVNFLKNVSHHVRFKYIDILVGIRWSFSGKFHLKVRLKTFLHFSIHKCILGSKRTNSQLVIILNVNSKLSNVPMYNVLNNTIRNLPSVIGSYIWIVR
jgi:hypothetical protein